jgi:hypothetical protein
MSQRPPKKPIPVRVAGESQVHLAPPRLGRVLGRSDTLCGKRVAIGLPGLATTQREEFRCPICYSLIDQHGYPVVGRIGTDVVTVPVTEVRAAFQMIREALHQYGALSGLPDLESRISPTIADEAEEYALAIVRLGDALLAVRRALGPSP